MFVVDGVNVNAELIRQGLAWHYLEYSNSDALDELESAAREAKRGLWLDATSIEPWNIEIRTRAAPSGDLYLTFNDRLNGPTLPKR